MLWSSIFFLCLFLCLFLLVCLLFQCLCLYIPPSVFPFPPTDMSLSYLLLHVHIWLHATGILRFLISCELLPSICHISEYRSMREKTRPPVDVGHVINLTNGSDPVQSSAVHRSNPRERFTGVIHKQRAVIFSADYLMCPYISFRLV